MNSFGLAFALSRVLQADWLIMENNEKATLNMSYSRLLQSNVVRNGETPMIRL